MADRPRPPRLVLASASPRRRDLLALFDLDFDTVVAEVDETPLAGESADALVARLACAKARTVATPGDVVIGADTVVVVDGSVLGKPRDPLQAAAMLASLSGRAHTVLTGLVVIDADGEERQIVERTEVRFRDLDAAEIRAYVESGEPLDKAGAYAIQGRGGRFVTSIDGSYHNVVGLPLAQLEPLIRAALSVE